MMNEKERPSKKERQEKFVARCLQDGLSAAEAFERASVFPMLPQSKIKILRWPKF